MEKWPILLSLSACLRILLLGLKAKWDFGDGLSTMACDCDRHCNRDYVNSSDYQRSVLEFPNQENTTMPAK